MKFKQLTQDYRDDHLAEAMYARETEWFHYDFDRMNFEKILKDLPDGDYKNELQKRLLSTIDQMAKVDAIYHALESQIANQNQHAKAVKRMAEKRAK